MALVLAAGMIASSAMPAFAIVDKADVTVTANVTAPEAGMVTVNGKSAQILMITKR